MIIRLQREERMDREKLTMVEIGFKEMRKKNNRKKPNHSKNGTDQGFAWEF